MAAGCVGHLKEQFCEVARHLTASKSRHSVNNNYEPLNSLQSDACHEVALILRNEKVEMALFNNYEFKSRAVTSVWGFCT